MSGTVPSISSPSVTTATTAALSGLSNTPATTQVGAQANDPQMNEFLTLLVAQLQNQDPMNPTDPTQFVSQLAQFSTVEQLTQSNSTLNNISSGVTSSRAGPVCGADQPANQRDDDKPDDSDIGQSSRDDVQRHHHRPVERQRCHYQREWHVGRLDPGNRHQRDGAVQWNGQQRQSASCWSVWRFLGRHRQLGPDLGRYDLHQRHRRGGHPRHQWRLAVAASGWPHRCLRPPSRR